MATVFSQAARHMRVDTVLSPTELLLTAFSGHEGVSMPFGYQLDLVSPKPNIDGKDLLRTAATIAVKLSNGQERYINGLISRFVQLGSIDKLTSYRAELAPWWWFLTLSRDCKIFQKKTVPDIIEEVFGEFGYTDYELNLTGSYKPREFCVQYRETHFNFVSRLMEDEGIFYFFKHEAKKHILVLADNNNAFTPGPIPIARVASRSLAGEDLILSLQREESVHIGKVTLSEYDYLQPNLTLRSSVEGNGEGEIHDYLPIGYTSVDDGNRYARIQLEAEEAKQQTLRGDGNCRFFQSGYRFTLKDHYRTDLNNKDYTLLEVQHDARIADYLSAGGGEVEYQNHFLAIPHSIPYRPPVQTQRPLIHGLQSAIVVGPAGEEIYTDSHGRVKVQFYWDRLGKKDEHSSCWVRVASPYAGKAWGNITIPRIGNEVVVEFLEGDPDRPLIVGSVYNADQTPPFTLPGAGIQQGVKSRSSPGGGGYNEITVTDTKGKEMIVIHGQYDMTTTIEHDQTDTINNNRTTTIAVDDAEEVGSNQTIQIGANQTTTVDGNREITVAGNQKVTVDGNETIKIGGSQNVDVSGAQVVKVGGARKIDVGADDIIEAAAKMKHGAGANFELDAGADLKANATANMKLTAGAKVDMSAGATITLTAGGSSIEIGPAGIKITSPAMVTVMGATIKLN